MRTSNMKNRPFLNWLDKQEKILTFIFLFISVTGNVIPSWKRTKKSKDILPCEFLKYSSENTCVFSKYPSAQSI